MCVKRILALVSAFLLALSLTAVPVLAEGGDTWYFSAEAAVDGDGTKGSPFMANSLGAVMNNENLKDGDTAILIGSFSSAGSQNSITKAVHLLAGEGGSLSGGVSFAFDEDAAGTITIDGFTFARSCVSGTPTLLNMNFVFQNCTFSDAGGNCLYFPRAIGSLTVDNCTFETQTDQETYTIWPYDAQSITITNSNFDGGNLNRGAIHLGDGNLTERDRTVVISGNTIQNYERAVQIAFQSGNNSVTIENNTITGIAHQATSQKT